MLIVVKKEYSTNDVIMKLKMKLPTVNIIDYSDIKCIYISLKDSENLREFDEVRKNFLSKYIETFEYKMSMPEYIRTIFSHNTIAKYRKHESNKFIQREFDKNLSDLKDIFRELTWDIGVTTNDGKSYDIEKGDKGVKVGIIDSGIDLLHPDLKKNIIGAKSFVPYEKSVEDFTGHGTMVAGIIAANGRMKGVAPNIGIFSYKVFDKNNTSNSIWVLNAIIEAIKDEMDVINLSLSMYKSLFYCEDRAMIMAFNRVLYYAEKNKCVIVASSGTELEGYDISRGITKFKKDNRDIVDIKIHIPGGLKNIITVASSDREYNAQSTSNYGTNVNLYAPVGSVKYFENRREININYATVTTYPTYLCKDNPNIVCCGYILNFGGTSLAVPKVSAAIALIIARYKNKYGVKPEIDIIKKYLYEGADGCSNDEKIKLSYGVVNVESSLRLI